MGFPKKRFRDRRGPAGSTRETRFPCIIYVFVNRIYVLLLSCFDFGSGFVIFAEDKLIFCQPLFCGCFFFDILCWMFFCRAQGLQRIRRGKSLYLADILTLFLLTRRIVCVLKEDSLLAGKWITIHFQTM